MITTVFDQYSLQARLRPALLALFPIFITVAVWMPALYEVAVGLVSLAVACGLTTIFAHFARARGSAVQDQLIEEWGGLPSTLWLRQADHHLESETKQRYYRFLEQHVPDWKAPTSEEEGADRDKADRCYGSAVRWLLEYTRDTKQFSLVFKENISYGFCRNALGLKPFAIMFALIAGGFGTFLLYSIPSSVPLSERMPQVAAVTVSLVLLIWWVFGVTRSWVRDAADAYAKALLAACDKS